MHGSVAKVLVGLTLGALALIPRAAGADSKSVEDERDANQKVDPVEATHAHHESLSEVLVHTVEMAEPWQDGELFGGVLKVWLPDGDRAVDRLVHIGFNQDGSMYGLVDDEKGRTRGYANVWLKDDRTIQLDIPRRLFGKTKSYKWAIALSFECSASEGECAAQTDRVPNQGKIRHDL